MRVTAASKRVSERLVVLLLVGFLALNYPLLALFDKVVLWFGVPALYLYLFIVWTLFIGLMAAVMKKKEPPTSLPKSPRSRDST